MRFRARPLESTTASVLSACLPSILLAHRAMVRLRGPGYFNMDLSAFKSFAIYKEQQFQFRFDAFNAFNIVSYGNPDTTVTDTAFGQIGSQNNIRSQERRLQFSAKYSF